MKPKLLVIEDDEMVLALFRHILAEGGFDVFSTADGPRGIEIYKEMHPEIVLLDLALPTMNGLEVLRTIKGLDRNACVIVVTGYGSEESADVAFRYGASDFIEKPFEPLTLLGRIQSVSAKNSPV